MLHPSVSPTSTASSRRLLPLAVIALWGGLAACGDGESASLQAGSPGALVEHPPSSATRSKRFVVDPHHGGRAAQVRLLRLLWGRQVDVFDIDETGQRRLQHEDYVVGADVTSNGFDVLLESNPLTRREALVIRHTLGAEDGLYEEAFAALDRNLQPIQDRSFDEVGLYTMVPRNAVVVAVFDDLIDPLTVAPDSVQVFSGTPPNAPFESRLLPDFNHGDLVSGPGGPEFRSTRVIIDPTISELESFATEPPLPINGVGFPAALNVNLANVVLRMPTKPSTATGTERVLRNLTGHVLATAGNGSIDFGSPTIDVVRHMRSGGPGEVTGDPYNGFLRDQDPPVILGKQTVMILDVPAPDPDSEEPTSLVLPRIRFLSPSCSRLPEAGDVIQQSDFYAEVLSAEGSQVPLQFADVRVRLLLGAPEEWAASALGAAQFNSAFDPVRDLTRQACFVGVLPTSSGHPDRPLEGVSTEAVILLRFSEPMDPASVTAFDSLTLTRVAEPLQSSDYVVGRVSQSLDLAEFQLAPDLPLAHQEGNAETYFLNLVSGARGPTDLAGNPVLTALAQQRLLLDPDEATQRNGGRVSRFTSSDEDPPIGDEAPLPEWIGQHLYDQTFGVIRPRPVIRSQVVVNQRIPILSLLSPFPQGVQTPLSRLGSKLQTVWRYADFGFGLIDDTTANIDIEGLHWSSANGQVVADFYPEFEIRLSHASKLPDELVSSSSLLPAFPQSGIFREFGSNLLSASEDPQQIVHPKHLGYVVNPDDAVDAGHGTLLIPWPLNRDLPVRDHRYYTWRDTSLLLRAAPSGGGVDLRVLVEQLGVGTRNLMLPDRVSTIGLPLLMEFRCFPDDGAVGLNPFNILLGNLASPQPNFRAYSTGGLNQAGVVVRIDPETETIANGGFNPNSMPPGAPTRAVDNTVYLGAADFITRVSRSVSLWFEAVGGQSPRYRPAVIEPVAADQPAGTSVGIAFRGANAAEPAAVREDASSLDLYGDHYDIPSQDRSNPNPSISFIDGGVWHDDIREIDGAPYYQIRVTFDSNAEAATVPELSALAVAWEF